MQTRTHAHLLAAYLLLSALPAMGATLLIRGKVVMQDGSAPAKSITIERFCVARVGTRVVANTMKTGQFIYTAEVDAMAAENCALRAVASGFESTIVKISHLNPWSDPNLPEIILRPRDASLSKGNTVTDSDIYFTSSSIPPNARQPWSNAIEAQRKGNIALAEAQVRIVVKEAPKMADAWTFLGDVEHQLNKPLESAQAYQKAVELNPKLTTARLGLLWAFLSQQKWPEAEATADALIAEKADAQFPEVLTNLAVARFNRGNLAGAESSAIEGLRKDTKHQFPRAEMVLATILESESKFDSAREHMQRYLELEPRAADAAEIRERMNNLGKAASPGAPAPMLVAVNAVVDAAGEAWVPGGMKALATMAGMSKEPAYQTFFEEYCRAVGREVSVGTTSGIPKFTQGLRAFLAAVSELIPLGEKRGDNALIRISVADREKRQQAQGVLARLGWTVEERDEVIHVEPGYRPEDALLQTVASALGIDQISMQETLQAGKEFSFEIVSENARLVGGNVWTQILRQDAVPPGGLAAVFATDPRIGKTCAGLNAMNAASAATIMSTVGLRNLALKDAEVLYRYSEAFVITNGRADVPGGPAADAAWQKLVGANPANASDFFRALLDKDVGRLAAFFWTLSKADAAHQRYFTASPERADRFYQWFRVSPELRGGIVSHLPGFHSEFLHGVPLDSAGNIRFPGEQSAWFSGADLPLDNAVLEALIPVARLEAKRGAPIDGALAGLLARNHRDWAPLYSYFERFPALAREEFAALASFTEAAARRSAAERSAVLGEWYALVELIARGTKAGSMDATAAARAFRQVSADLAGDAHATQALTLLRQLAGGADEDAVAEKLLRLDERSRAGFDRVLGLLHAPRIADAKTNEIPAAMTALVYAAALDPGLLVLNEDPGLLQRHRHGNEGGPLFARAVLHGSEDVRGTHFSGGFAGFEEAAKSLMGGAKAAPRVPVVARVAPQVQAATGGDLEAPDFRSDSKLVEVYATVTDGRGRYIDDLKQEQFALKTGKDPQTIFAFEPQTSELSVALLLDTTGSMVDTIASLKRAAIKLIDSLRPGDAVAVYSFSDQVTELAAYTTDRGVVKRAVMNARANGNTALYDAVARTGHELTGRVGKKVVIVFTDGRDTSSMLTVEAAIERSKVAGVPVYTIAEGDATKKTDLLEQLSAISNATGGVSFQVRDPDDMGKIFEKVAEDLAHGYLLYFQSPEQDDHAWREIDVNVKDLKVRAREGYYP